MKFPMNVPVKIVMLGAGGTGAFAAPHIYRLLYALERPARFIICDGDVVEAKKLEPPELFAGGSGREQSPGTGRAVCLGIRNGDGVCAQFY